MSRASRLYRVEAPRDERLVQPGKELRGQEHGVAWLLAQPVSFLITAEMKQLSGHVAKRATGHLVCLFRAFESARSIATSCCAMLS